MSRLQELRPYSDDRGNVVEYAGEVVSRNISVNFRGGDNRLIVESPARIDKLQIHFDGEGGEVHIGRNERTSGSHLRLSARVGSSSVIKVGSHVTMTSSCYMTVTEGCRIDVGDDCMIASGNELRAHDGHPIFDVSTGARVNRSASIFVGDHVWLAKDAILLSGARVGEGTVIGLRSVVTGVIPNNVVAVGAPAKVVRRDVAWERPNLTLSEPIYVEDDSHLERSTYWKLTLE